MARKHCGGTDVTQDEREERQEREGSESGNRVTEDKLEKPEETKRQNSRAEPDNSASSTRQGEATAAQDLEKLLMNDEGKERHGSKGQISRCEWRTETGGDKKRATQKRRANKLGESPPFSAETPRIGLIFGPSQSPSSTILATQLCC